MEESTDDDGGKVLLLLVTRDAQSAEELVARSDMSPDEVARQLHQLTDQGFVIAGSIDAGVAVYQLNPKGVRTVLQPAQQRILVVDDTVALSRLMRVDLEDEGYTIIATAVQADAVSLLQEVSFDLVITDSFSSDPGASLVRTTDIIAAADATPVALFTGHRVELEATHEAGFADLISKPFDIDVLAEQVRTLLNAAP
jgi:CheY-like chemotaxis protein